MDRWEAALEDLQQSQTLDSFGKVLFTAESVLKEDLAPFELDWFVQTLLSEPVSLLDAIPGWVSNEAWSKLVKDAYKLLSDLVNRHYDTVETYFQDIVAACEKRQPPGTRASALDCLAACVRRAPLPADPAGAGAGAGAGAARYVHELEHATTCKAPLAILIGTICECHPDSVVRQFKLIWRTYLNMLTANKNTVRVREAVLRGVWGLFRSFGDDIPTRELSEFYDSLSGMYLCTAAVLSILRDYSPLFKERLAADAAVRSALWTCGDPSALRAVYEAVATALTQQQLQKIFDAEILPRTLSEDYKIRFSALRVAGALHGGGHVGAPRHTVDVHALELQLRGQVDHEAAEALSWCLEANVVNSEKLLQTAIMFYGNLPASRRKEIVVSGLLNAPANIMHMTLNFLVTESCRSEESLRALLPLWGDVVASSLADQRAALLERYMDNFLLVLDNYLDDDSHEYKDIPEKLCILLSLTSHILRLSPEVCVREQGPLIAPRLARLARVGLNAPVVDLLATISCLQGDQYVLEMYESLRFPPAACADAALQRAWAGALVRAPAGGGAVLLAIEMILSRRDAEPRTLSMAIERLEAIILSKDDYNKSTVSKCIRHMERLRSGKAGLGSDARVLLRDVTLFLGKYYTLAGAVDDLNAEDNVLIVKLTDKLDLDIPNPTEGITYKMDLSRLLHSAIAEEHEPSLRMLLNVICAKLCTGPCPGAAAALGRALAAACRARAAAAASAASPLAATHHFTVETTKYILQQIGLERSPAVRAMLSELVEAVLLREPGSVANEPQLQAVYTEAVALMTSKDSVLKLGGLGISKSLLAALKDDRLQAQALLPNLTVLISKTREADTSTVLENSTKLFLDNIGLFSAKVLDSTTQDLLKAVVDMNWEVTDAKVYRNTVKVVLSFVKGVMNYTNESTSKVTSLLFELQSIDVMKFLYVLTEMTIHLELGDDDLREVLDYENGLALERVFDTELEVLEKEFALEVHLRFINRFAAVLFKFHSLRTLKHLASLIDRLPTEHVRSLRRHLTECLTHCRQIVHSTPDPLLKSFESWSEGLPLKDITEHIEKEKFSSNHAMDVSALDSMLDIFRLKNPIAVLTTVSIFAKDWPNIVLRIYASGHIKYFKKYMPYLTDLLSVSLRFLTVTDVKSMILDANTTEMGNERVGMQFCRFFMRVFFKYLVKKPFMLVQADMECCSALLIDVVKCSVRHRWDDDQLENLLVLVDQVWPAYERQAFFRDKLALLREARGLRVGLAPGSRPMRWASELVAGDADVDEKVAVVSVLPGEDAYSETYRRLASLLPPRLSDMDARSRAALQALLDAAAGGARCVLLDILVTLADGDDTAGWWDEAFDSCMASVAVLPSTTLDLLSTVYKQCLCLSPAVCSRLLVPLLRYSPPALCEKFFATTLSDLLGRLQSGVKAPSLHAEYRHCVQQKTSLLDILQVLFERVPAANIESPSSPLYEHLQTDKPWHAAREVIHVCFRLRGKLVSPLAAPPALDALCRAFHQSAFKCMCACICVRRPDAAVYGTVWDGRVWDSLVCPADQYHLPLSAGWRERKILRPASIPSEDEESARARSRSRSRSRSVSTSRVFLRTLSENPLEYDLIDHTDTHMIDTAEVEMSDNCLNRHPCAGTLTALFRHAEGGASHAAMRGALRAALSEGSVNLRWLLSQAVCNSREELKPYASELRPALLSVVADEADTDSGLALLNGLHIDILNTLIHWDEDIHLPAPSRLNVAINCLVFTALESCARPPLFERLAGVLGGLLRTYGSLATGDFAVFEKNFDDPNRTKSCLKLLLCFAKHRVPVPGLLPALLTKLSDNYRIYRSEVTPLAELIGLEITNRSEDQTTAAARLKMILEDVKKHSLSNYVKIIYYTKCCDAQQFRKIVELTLKVPEADRKKCLRIMSAYLREHPAAPEAADMPPNIRELADTVHVDTHFEELFTSTPQFFKPSGSAKRLKVEASSPLLSTIGMNERHVSEVLARLGPERVGRLQDKLCNTSMAVRLAECFYVCVYLPVRYRGGDRPGLCACLSECHHLLLCHPQTQDAFKQNKLRDEPWNVENVVSGSIRTRTKKTVGTVRGLSCDTTRYAREDTDDPGIDVQVTVDKVLDSIVQFAKVSPSAALELARQLVRCAGAGRGFDARAVLARLTAAALRDAPELVLLAREYAQELASIDGFLETIDKLRVVSVGSEGEQGCRLLLEEARLWGAGDAQFVLGAPLKTELDVFMGEQSDFTIENMVSAFGKLSNWDELPLEERRLVEAPDFPPLWTDKQHFRQLLDEYTDRGGWFGQMVSLYRGDRRDLMKWLRAAERWPRNHYALAAMTEAMQWHSVVDVEELQAPRRMERAACLAEWAARLMLRTAFITEKWDSDATLMLSRSHELEWCRAANERGLHNMALAVIRRNCLDDLYEGETLQWMEQKLLATSSLGFKQNDLFKLEETLERAEELTQFYRQSPPEAVLGVNALVMKINSKLQLLTTDKIDNITREVEAQVQRINERGALTSGDERNVSLVYDTAVLHYDTVWRQNEQSNDEILVEMSSWLGRLTACGAEGATAAAVLLARLRGGAALGSPAATAVLSAMKPILSKLPSYYLDALRESLPLFPAEVVRASGMPELQVEPAIDKLKLCLQLLCHADHLLLQYCEQLGAALDDDEKWSALFTRMMRRVFGNQFAGPDFQVLAKYRARLDGIRDADPQMKRDELRRIVQELRAVPARETVRVSHVCPALAGGTGGSGLLADLGRLLALPPGVHVVSIQDEMSVFSDSVRRPCVVRVRDSKGRARRYLHKNEPLLAHAAVTQCPLVGDTGCAVIPLGEDCGLIEFLEEHQRIRDLVAGTRQVQEVCVTRQAVKDEELILAPTSASLQSYNNLCSQVPAHLLRSAIERQCVSVEDFIAKKRHFLNTLADGTITCWLFGLGDRHLHNLLYSRREGGVRSVDWGALFEYGVGELPPARLTRNLLAVNDTKVLVSRLQSRVAALRESAPRVLPALQLAFRWMPDFHEKLVYIEGIMRGKMAAHEVIKDSLRKSSKKHKAKYSELLDAVFRDHQVMEEYSVEDQVSCLLRACTEPAILAVTRSGWEPWL